MAQTASQVQAKTAEDDLNDLLEETSTARALTTTASPPALTVYDGDDGFAAAAAEADQKTLKGEIAKFIDGVWSIGGALIPPKLRLLVERVFAVWVRWENQRPAEYSWPRPSGLLPSRETLSHLEEKDWPAGADGEPSDPWRNTRFVWLLDPATMQSFTATNSTVGMRRAYEDLGRAVATPYEARPRSR
jgi:hypothetical protein